MYTKISDATFKTMRNVARVMANAKLSYKHYRFGVVLPSCGEYALVPTGNIAALDIAHALRQAGYEVRHTEYKGQMAIAICNH